MLCSACPASSGRWKRRLFPLYRSDGAYDPTELADWFHQQAPDIAYRFDQRNGYPAHQKKIETAWAGTQEMANQSN